jgi:hypothetical protein
MMKVSIDKNKTYKTKDGAEVEIYSLRGAGEYSVIGAMKLSRSDNPLSEVLKCNDDRLPCVWTIEGKFCLDDESGMDLVEVQDLQKSIEGEFHD